MSCVITSNHSSAMSSVCLVVITRVLKIALTKPEINRSQEDGKGTLVHRAGGGRKDKISQTVNTGGASTSVQGRQQCSPRKGKWERLLFLPKDPQIDQGGAAGPQQPPRASPGGAGGLRPVTPGASAMPMPPSPVPDLAIHSNCIIKTT